MSINDKHEKNAIQAIIDIKESLPNKQKKLCDYILENHELIGTLTVKELADKAGVGTTTVLRVMKKLGYDTFQDMRKDFLDLSLKTSYKWKYVQESFKKKDVRKELETLHQVWQEGFNLMEKTLNPNLIENFKTALDIIAKASRINILGLRIYKAAAIFFELLTEEFYSKTRQLSYDSDSMFDRIIQFQQDEVLIVFAIEPYTTRTIDAAEIAAKNGVSVILITDRLSCPIVPFATVTLKVETSKKHFTILPIIALIEAIVIELGKRNSEVAIPTIDKLAAVLKEKNVTLS
ncbi:MurR/RpiR family transcriptional regulator [Aeribacillus composti]|uniref:MurR/RpiR family transcriptional regulator n=1 Tax=Aeribacillus composti TaxID=1868734 RepID=UPI00406A66A6